jgi:hypothetical protein
MAINETIANTIQDLIGSDMDETLVTTYEDLIASGFNFIADTISSKSELWDNSLLSSADITSSTYTINDNSKSTKVISVTRTESGDIERIASEVSYNDYLRGTGTTSIFYHGKSTRSPIWSMKPTGDLIISPTPVAASPAKVYYFEYIDNAISTLSATALHQSAAGAGQGFPRQAFQAGCIKAALNLINALISNAVQDDEDAELLQLLQAQSAYLQTQLQTEMQRLGIPYKIVGVEDDVK